MNNLKQFFSNQKNKRIIIVSVVLLLIIVPYILGKVFTGRGRPSGLTVPIIPPTPTISSTIQTPLDTTNPFNPTQKLVFIWGSIVPEIPKTIDNYQVKTPLVTRTSISTVANKFGFSVTEASPYTDENSLLWTNAAAGLFGSPKQNQILFNSAGAVPEHANTIPQAEAVDLSKSIIANLFGTPLLSTFSPNPEIKYLNLDLGIEDEPAETTPELANLVNVNFTQTIDGLPFLNLSKRGETISVAMDTNKRIYLLYVYGGYQSLTNTGSATLIDFAQLTEIAPTNAIRISTSQDVPSEAAYTAAKTIRIGVTSAGLGYFQRADNSIFPVFVIKGNMSAVGLSEYPATFVVPATAN